ncbi:hypothetical protein BaRGS_00011122 [Batillaria attramentaria]|uniref:Apple domain-containing protein n=1 Tax=Batillaria attramentaria TaxID=370345 RepID=A0ABD0LF97_9CAEN
MVLLELSAFKAMLQLTVAFLVLTQDSCTCITAARTALWSSIPRNRIILDTKSTAGFGARSVTHCTVECFVDADCHEFCYDVSADRCYVSDVSTSQDPVPEIEALRCYYEGLFCVFLLSVL